VRWRARRLLCLVALWRRKFLVHPTDRYVM
jgi:hypothetical protein